MKKSVKKNYIFNLINQILSIFMPIITTPYLARVLGANGVGTYSYTLSIIAYFILFGSLGLSLYGQREIAYNQNDVVKRSKIFYELFILKLLTMIIPLIIYIFMFCIKGEYVLYFRILLLELIATCIDISWFYQGIEEFQRLMKRNLLVRVANIFLVFLFIRTANDVDKYLFIYCFNSFIGFLSFWIGIKKHITKISIREIDFKRHLKPMIILFIPQIAIEIYVVLDKTMIGFILNDMSEVGYYEQAQKIVKMIMTIVTSLGTVMISRIAACYAQNKTKEIKEYMLKTFNYILFMAFPMIFGINSISKNFVPVFFGDGYSKVVVLMNLMSLIILFIGFSGVIGNQFLLTHKRQKQFTISVIIGAVTNVVLNFILIKPFLSAGAVIATVCAELSVTTAQLYFIRKDFNILEILKVSKKYILSSVFMFMSCQLINLFALSNLVSIVLKVILGFLIYILVLILQKDDFVIYIIKTVVYKIPFLNKIVKNNIGKDIK